ncbi:Integrator complex subunit 14 [Frankliniella fusca]|uniref:Integrator complex subunit 14 n=1 Tax=Frankliniella fusca TaxID=407009 RepID=A0AAE1LH00_9NEOP|nr:Integrator complex subunit 14 [Frankliniella fusca]
MPTIVLLDVSLSMARPVSVPDSGETYSRLQLAIHGINTLLDYFNVYTRLEFVSLLTYSSLCDELCPFTRDFDSIKQKLQTVEDQDKTCIEPALHAVNRLVLKEWGSTTPCHVIIVSDGSCGATDSSFKHILDRNAGPHRPCLPFAFPGKLSALIIANPNEPQLSHNLQMFKRLTDLAGGEGLIHTPEGPLSIASVQAMVRKMAEAEFTSYQGTLRCGCLSSKITLSPHPLPFTHVKDFSTETYRIGDQLDVVGFLDLSDIGSPAAVSRHLVLPMGSGLSNNVNHPDVKNEDSDDENHDEGKTSSFCVLLHGALKVENMAALCEVAEGWFGILFSWADNKKKSNLMLTVLEPGTDAIPWLGDLEQLGSAEDAEDLSALPSFPVRPAEKRSYSQSTVAWIRQSGLHSDIQKILRSARKLPDKTQHFYKELNRVRKAAVQVGFLELLDGLSKIFEKECHALPDKAHPDCALQLTHCASVLRKKEARELKFAITPLRTSFLGGDD